MIFSGDVVSHWETEIEVQANGLEVRNGIYNRCMFNQYCKL